MIPCFFGSNKVLKSDKIQIEAKRLNPVIQEYMFFQVTGANDVSHGLIN